MKKLILLILSILLQVGFVNAQLNGTYQIGASQPFPFNTITNAVDNISTVGVSGAVIFLLTDNLYEESGIEFITVPGTSTTNTITLRPANGVDAVIQGAGEYVFGIDRTSHLTFEGKSPDGTGSLTITSTETVIGSSVIKSTHPTNISGNDHNLHVSNCTINAAPPFFSEEFTPKSYGFNMSSFHFNPDSIILNNNIFSGGDFSIYLSDNSGSYIIYKIINNQFISSGSIAVKDAVTKGTSCTIQGNNFTNTNISSSSELSIIYFFGGLEVDINNNFFNDINYDFTSFNKEFNAFYFIGTKNINIFNNVIKNINYNATFTPVPGFDLGTFFSVFKFMVNENIKFHHNSVYIPLGNENGFLSDEAIFTGIFLYDNQNIECKNNIFTILQGNKPGETVNSIARIYHFGSETDISTLQSDNNSYYVDNHTNNYFYSTSTSQNDNFSQWQTTYPIQDQNSYWEMPKVISKDNLHLAEDCNRGTPIAEVPLDIEGTERNISTPDIGAYELVCPSLSGIYTINNSQATANRNFNNFTDAVEALKCGGISDAVTFNVANGTYNEQITIPFIEGSSATDTITFRSASGVNSDVVLQSSATNVNAVLVLNSAAHIRIKRMSINNLTTSGNLNLYAIYVWNQSEDVVIENNLINGRQGYDYACAAMNLGASNILVINNIIKNGAYGITGGEGANVSIRNNVISDFYISGIYTNASARKWTIEANDLYSLRNEPSNQFLTGINLTHSDSIFVLRNNIKLSSQQRHISGLTFEFGNKYSFAANNFINLNGSNFMRGVYFWSTSNKHFFHNTIFITGIPNSIQYNSCVRISSSPANNYIQNNILISLREDKIFSIENSGLNPINYNNYYTNGNVFALNSGTYYNNYTDWSASFPDNNSTFQNVSFTSATNLHLLAGQDFLKVTNPLTQVTTDIDGDLRNATNPYCGADEIVGNEISILLSNSCQLEVVNFQISNTTNIQSVLWNFGDSQTSTEFRPTHIYTNAGTYTVTLTVTYTDSSIKTISKEIEIYSKPLKPIIEHE